MWSTFPAPDGTVGASPTSAAIRPARTSASPAAKSSYTFSVAPDSPVTVSTCVLSLVIRSDVFGSPAFSVTFVTTGAAGAVVSSVKLSAVALALPALPATSVIFAVSDFEPSDPSSAFDTVKSTYPLLMFVDDNVAVFAILFAALNGALLYWRIRSEDETLAPLRAVRVCP